jgi:hypothetical protein
VKNIYGYKKTQNFMLISNSLMPAFKNAPKKIKSKKPRKNAQNENSQNLHRLLTIAFFRGICLSRHQGA